MNDHLPPHNLEAERALLSGIFFDQTGAALRSVDAWLRPEHLYDPAHRRIWQAALAVSAAGSRPDTVAVATWLREEGLLKECGGTSFLARIVDETPAVADAPVKLGKIIVDHYRLRQLCSAARDIAAQVVSGKHIASVDDFAAEAETAIVEAGKSETACEDAKRGLRSVQEIMTASQTRTLKPRARANCITGIHRLDRATGGLRPGFVWLIGAATSWGKSSLLVLIAHVNLCLGRVPLIVSSEDSEELYGDRLLALRSGVNAIRLREGCLTADEQQRVAETVAKAEKCPVYYDARGKPLEIVVRDLERILREVPIDLVACDYVQEFRPSAKVGSGSETEKLAESGRQLRMTIKRANKAGILFSQITEDQNKTRPDRTQIRYCRDISNGAEVIALGFEAAGVIKNRKGEIEASAGEKCVFVDKCKNGPRNITIPLQWDEDCACFRPDTVPEPTGSALDEEYFAPAPPLEFSGPDAAAGEYVGG